MKTARPRRLGMFAALLMTTGLLTAIAAPASATEKPLESCWFDSDTGVTQCFADEEALVDAVVDQTGSLPVDDLPLSLDNASPASRAGAALASTFVLARLYADASYGGAVYLVTDTSSTACTAGSGISSNLSGSWNDRVSSFRSYLGCATRIWEDEGQAGDYYGYATNAAGVGGMNDRASSFRTT